MAQPDELSNIIYLSLEDYQTLLSTGTVTIDGDPLTYDPNAIYMVPATDIPLPPADSTGVLESVNGIIGWKDESNFVDTTSTQTITGVKTFANDIIVSYITDTSNNRRLFITNTGNIYENANHLPYYNNSSNLGSSSYTWKDLYLGGIAYTDTIRGKTNTTYGFTIGAGYVGTSGHLLPNSHNTYDIGSSSNKWKDAYIQGILYGVSRGVYVDNIFNNLYGKYDNNDSTTELGYNAITKTSKTANTTFTFNNAPTGCYPEYKAIITNSGSSAIALTFTGVNHILCNDDNISVVSNVLTLPAGVTIEISCINNNLVAINFSA